MDDDAAGIICQTLGGGSGGEGGQGSSISVQGCHIKAGQTAEAGGGRGGCQGRAVQAVTSLHQSPYSERPWLQPHVSNGFPLELLDLECQVTRFDCLISFHVPLERVLACDKSGVCERFP